MLVAAATFVTAPRAQESGISEAALHTRIEQALAVAPGRYERLLSPQQAGVRVLSVAVDETTASRRVTIDLSQRALTYEASGHIEPLLDQIIQATASAFTGSRAVDYRFTIDGLSLEQFLPKVDRLVPQGRSATAGGVVLVSPGHGWYLDEALGSWRLQRNYYRGIVEDVVNWEIARDVRDELLAANTNAQMVRYAERDQTQGPSGKPRWEESAKYFVQALGVPGDIWNVGVDEYARDINARPFYANWLDAAVLVSIHNNGGGGTGTETWYDDTNGYQEQSRRLAEAVNSHIVSALRARYNRNWPDRGLRTCNGCKGENRLALRPAVIVEAAFMDTPSPDNDALHDDTFKRIVAQAIRAAITEWVP